jgi:hypothetical protein
MRKDSIQESAIESAYLIYKEHGHQILDYSHDPTDYHRGTVMEPEVTSKLKQAYNELRPANVSNGERYEGLKAQVDALDLRIDEQQNKLRVCRMRGNFQEFHRCMKEMQDMIKEKERLDAAMAVAAPGGNIGQKQMDDYDRTMDQDDFSEMTELSERIANLEAAMAEYLQFAESVEEEEDEASVEDEEFAQCQTPSGKTYGTAGKCQAPNKPITAKKKEDDSCGYGMGRKRCIQDRMKKEIKESLDKGDWGGAAKAWLTGGLRK